MPATIDSLRNRFLDATLLLDGAMGTELERRGVPCSLPMWSAAALLTAPDVVLAIHLDHLTAGAEIIVANTFRTNPRTLRRGGHASDGAALNSLAIGLARQAMGTRSGLVAASVAPVEDCYSPERVPSEQELRDEHGQMMDWIGQAGPDLVWIETMNAVREARIAAEAAAERGLPFAVSFVVEESGSLLGSEPLGVAVAAIEPLEPLAIGLNCVPPRGMSALAPCLRRMTARPLAAYAQIANALPIPGWSYSQDATPDEYAAYTKAWLDMGVSIVGGCCGTTPAHIRAVRTVLDRRKA